MCVCVCVCVWEGEERELYKNCFHFHLEKEQAFKCWSNSLCWRYTATAKPLQGATMVHSRPMHKQPSSTSCPHNKHRESIHLSFTTLAPTKKKWDQVWNREERQGKTLKWVNSWSEKLLLTVPANCEMTGGKFGTSQQKRINGTCCDGSSLENTTHAQLALICNKQRKVQKHVDFYHFGSITELNSKPSSSTYPCLGWGWGSGGKQSEQGHPDSFSLPDISQGVNMPPKWHSHSSVSWVFPRVSRRRLEQNMISGRRPWYRPRTFPKGGVW